MSGSWKPWALGRAQSAGGGGEFREDEQVLGTVLGKDKEALAHRSGRRRNQSERFGCGLDAQGFSGPAQPPHRNGDWPQTGWPGYDAQ